MYKVVSFDIWGTLIDSNPEFKKQRNIEIAKYLKTINVKYSNLTIEEITVIVNDVFNVLKKEYNHLAEELGLGFSTFDVFAKVALMLSCPGNFEMIKSINDRLFLQYLPTVKDGVLEALSILKQNDVKIILASNTVFVSQRIIKEALNMLGINASAHLSSDIFEVSKPNIKFYYEMYKYVNCPLTQAIHVGDNLGTDVVGPQKVGFNTYHVSKVYNKSVLTFVKENYEKA